MAVAASDEFGAAAEPVELLPVDRGTTAM